MDPSERIAEAHLKSLGFTEIKFEPEGKSKPPDFLVDARIAVEVRRLNQHEQQTGGDGRQRGLEEVAFPLRDTVIEALSALGPPDGESSWYVSMTYNRPVPSRRELQRAIIERLEEFRTSQSQEDRVTVRVLDNFKLNLARGGRRSDCFVLAGASDLDGGGWTVPELERNVQICIEQKTAKTAAIRSKYGEWWLILIDHISYGGNEPFRVPAHGWDRIILVSPLDHTRARVI